MTFFQLLDARASKTLLCVGLDPRSPTAEAAQQECFKLIDATAPYAAAFKPNAAFFERLGPQGWAALATVIKHVPKDIPVIFDAKRGDIADTGDEYAKSAFVGLGASAITASPYMGGDSLESFLKYKDKGVFVLCKTSNKGSNDLQTLSIDGRMLYEVVANRAQTSWNRNRNIGLVVGATDPVALARVRAIAPTLWLLVPGVGVQGGDLRKTVQSSVRGDSSGVLINVSRDIARASDPGLAAKKIMDEINAVRFSAKLTDLSQLLSHSGCVRFGKFTLKSGKTSPIYIDLRRLVTFPDVLRAIARHYCDILRHIEFDRLAGSPYAALPIATAVSIEMGKPLIYPRREAKEYGTKAVIEGEYHAGERVVIIDDLISTGETKIEAIDKLEKGAGLKVVSIVVLIDRDMGAKDYLAKRGYDFRAVASLSQLLPVWRDAGAISEQQMEEARGFIDSKL